MHFGQNRDQLRQFYLDSWRKYRAGAALEPMERVVAEVVAEHPEYHKLLEASDRALEREYLPGGGETNPFLHMGLHIALREQIAAERPAGIAAAYRDVVNAVSDRHKAEHAMIECLAEALWRAQRDGTPPDENAYLREINRLARKTASGQKR